jgi:hypothetical protein
MKNKIAQEQGHLMKSMAPRRFPTPYVLQRFHLFNSKLEQILATSLREREREREREMREQRVEEERFWNSNNTKSRCVK